MERPKGTEARSAGRPLPFGRRRRASVLVAAGSWLYLVIILMLWAALRAADLWWPATLLMFSPRWLLTLPLALLVPAAVVLRRRSLGVLVLTLVLIAGPVMGFCIPWQCLQPGTRGGIRVRVLTCNMHYRKGDLTALDRLLTETTPDLVALQEWAGSKESEVLAGHEWHVHRTPGLFLASRYPIREATNIGMDSTGEKGSVMRYAVETPAGVITLFSLHLATPRWGLYEVMHEGEQGATSLQAGTDLRGEQSENVAREAGAVTGPVLLAGDFNTPPESVIFRRSWGGYTDAFASSGWGWGYTFRNWRTMVRIDHILAGAGWGCERCWVGPDVGSPHHPVLADLTWQGTKAPVER
jgi:vancomycin resistance protein VanJ